MYVEEVQLLERDQGAIVDQTSISKMEEKHRLAFYQAYLDC
jgi:hypothetical protein